MAEQFSVVYDPCDGQPFSILKVSNKSMLAIPVVKSAEQWALAYNGGNAEIPNGLVVSPATSMDSDTIKSLISTEFRTEKIQRRLRMKSERETWQLKVSDVIYGNSNAPRKKSPYGITRKVFPVISHRQRDIYRGQIINKAIRGGIK